MKLKVIATADGSKTLKITSWNEHYHSTHGAVADAKHVYIKNGLKFSHSKHLSIFEMGFGTGLNAFLTYLNAKEKHIDYYSIDKKPLPIELIDQLDYVEQLNVKAEENIFKQMHHSKWNNRCKLSSNFNLYKIHDSIQNHTLVTHFDLVYYDAFGPRVQSELWQKEIFEKLVKHIKKEGVLVTYCAKGEVKRILKALGMRVESLAGPPGKREMIRAIRL